MASLAACSSAPKRTAPEFSRLEGKKIALVEVSGEPTARKVVEVALANQLLQKGTFILISKQDVESARSAPDQVPSDWAGIAHRAGADYALRVDVLAFAADEHEGYSETQVEDSELKEETGNGLTERLYKVKSLTGNVKIQMKFTDVSGAHPGETRSGIAEKSNILTAEGKNGGIHLPPRLRFLESLSNDAFRDFFEKYRD